MSVTDWAPVAALLLSIAALLVAVWQSPAITWPRRRQRVQEQRELTAYEVLGIQPQCTFPPPGWWCSRDEGHDGPCAARRLPRKALL